MKKIVFLLLFAIAVSANSAVVKTRRLSLGEVMGAYEPYFRQQTEMKKQCIECLEKAGEAFEDGKYYAAKQYLKIASDINKQYGFFNQKEINEFLADCEKKIKEQEEERKKAGLPY